MALDELKEDDGKIEVDGIVVAFNKQDKLYIHKSTIDYSEDYPGDGFLITPWFQGFR